MRVLHCIWTLGGGGAERRLAHLARQMAADGLETHVTFAQGGPNLRCLEQSDVILHSLPIRAKYDPRIISDLLGLIARLKPDIVQTWLTQMHIVAGLAAWWQQVPVVLTEGSCAIAYPPNIRNLVRRFVGGKAMTIVANSSIGKDYWRQQGFKRRVVIIRNGVPFEQISQTQSCSHLPSESEVALAAHEQLILFAGRYNEGKNVEVLLQAFSLALAQCQNAVAVLFGEGPIRERMRSIHATLPHRDRIHICSYTTSLWGYMRRANLFVSLSSFEGSPNVVLEAIACACPLVLSDIPAHREIVGDDSGLLVPAQNAGAAARAIVQLLADPDYASILAKRARRRVRHWSIDEAARQYHKLYTGLVRKENAEDTSQAGL